ncbi:amino acid--tRNA ligase-related protein [Hymenobacter nivis]|uniref:Uncharacterized protein n=1 Tax=Hymenobacter nivis TaxID=1850093 RepID=A0A2Z3GSU6_9BACT|nr:amino acid--tRNA ligase-related protein [Hymenobacter nivis]AWM34496.1 hypothetical protein DDQ68_17920 [Hymenobacter nivis]
MDSNTLAPEVAAALASAHAGNCNLSTEPKRMAVIKVWDAMFRGARKYVESEHFLAVHNMPHIVGASGACENTDTLFTIDWYDGKKMFLPQSNQLYIEMLTQKVESGRVYGEIQSFRKELKADNYRLVDIKFFNVRNNDDDPRVVNSTDLLLPLAGESAGADERELDGAKLRHKLKPSSMPAGLIRQGMKLKDFAWYLALPPAERSATALGRWRGHGPRGSVHPRPDRHPLLRIVPHQPRERYLVDPQ